MSRALSSYNEEQRPRVAERRLKNEKAERGNGWHAALQYYQKLGKQLPGKMGEAQRLSDTLKAAKLLRGNYTQEDSSRDRETRKFRAPREDEGRRLQRGSRKEGHINRMRMANVR